MSALTANVDRVQREDSDASRPRSLSPRSTRFAALDLLALSQELVSQLVTAISLQLGIVEPRKARERWQVIPVLGLLFPVLLDVPIRHLVQLRATSATLISDE